MNRTIGLLGLVVPFLFCAGCGGRDGPAAQPDTVTTLPGSVPPPDGRDQPASAVNSIAAPPERAGAESGPIARESIRKAQRFTAIVEVSVMKDGNPAGKTGTACCIDQSGLFATHAKLVEDVNQEKGQVRLILDNDGKSRRVLFPKVLRSDERIALLQIDPAPDLKLEPLTLAEEAGVTDGMDFDLFSFPDGHLDIAAARGARAGDNVARFKFNYGHPYQFQFPSPQPDHGRVAQITRDGDRIGLFFLDGGNPPNPGTPVLDRSGKLIGIAAPPSWEDGIRAALSRSASWRCS